MYLPGISANVSNSSNIVCPPYEQTLPIQICKTGLYGLIIILSLIGNTIVIFTVLKNQHMRSVTNLFISNLAASDLLITFLGMPNMISQVYLLDKWIFGEFLCKLVVFLQSVSVASSVLTLLVITKDRYMAIIYPFQPRMEFNTARIVLGVIWAASLGIMSPLIYATRVRTGDQGYEVCIEDWSPTFDRATAPRNYTVVLFLALYLTPLVTMAVLYSKIARKLFRRQQVGEHVHNVDPAQAARKKVIKMLITVVLLFAACWLPLYVYQFIVFFALEKLPCFDHNYAFYFTSLFLSHANSAINPFLYALFNRNYRDGFHATCQCFVVQNDEPRDRRGVHSNSSVIRNGTTEQDAQNGRRGKPKATGLRYLCCATRTREYYPPTRIIFQNGERNDGVIGISFNPKPSDSPDTSHGSIVLQFSNLSYNNDMDER